MTLERGAGGGLVVADSSMDAEPAARNRGIEEENRGKRGRRWGMMRKKRRVNIRLYMLMTERSDK